MLALELVLAPELELEPVLELVPVLVPVPGLLWHMHRPRPLIALLLAGIQTAFEFFCFSYFLPIIRFGIETKISLMTDSLSPPSSTCFTQGALSDFQIVK
ncbi:MAG: hypothetical protein A2144_00155 [Chloroflexi bacterium RBG_16_50_9]|nr:MAG: hypothetical protein A2144_00155 [Chloroflexi bacterium RBG_16_50_9]